MNKEDIQVTSYAEQVPFSARLFNQGMRDSLEFKELYYNDPKNCSGSIFMFIMQVQHNFTSIQHSDWLLGEVSLFTLC